VLHSLQEVAKSGLAVLQCGQFIIASGQGGSNLSPTGDYPAYPSSLQPLEMDISIDNTCAHPRAARRLIFAVWVRMKNSMRKERGKR